MRTIDEKDIEIVELLLEDARRPYSEIANKVDLSPPTVSDRIDRLQAEGVIRRFTLDVEESKIDEYADLLVEFEVTPGEVSHIEQQLDKLSETGRIYVTAEQEIIAELRSKPEAVSELLTTAIDMAAVEAYDIKIVSSESWSPSITSGDADARVVPSTQK